MFKGVFFMIFLSISLLGKTQEIEIYLFEEPIEISGTVVDISNGDVEMHQEFDVRNMSETDEILRITRVKLVELEGTEDRICWGTSDSSATCYPFFSVAPYESFTTAVVAEVESGGQGWLSTFHKANGISGCAQYRYYVINEADVRLDSVDVRFCSTAGLTKIATKTLSVYPNPTAEILTIMVSEDSNFELNLYDNSGRFIMKQSITKGANEVSLSNLPEGVYIYSVFNEGVIEKTGQLILKP